VLLAAKQDGVIPAIRPLLDDLRESRLFVSERLVALALATAEETDDPT
jgi:predicted nucleic acid-binding protein